MDLKQIRYRTNTALLCTKHKIQKNIILLFILLIIFTFSTCLTSCNSTTHKSLEKESPANENKEVNKQFTFLYAKPITSLDQNYSSEESNTILQKISSLQDTAFETAKTIEDFAQETPTESQLVILSMNETGTIKIYGHVDDDLSAKGIIVNYYGVLSYFDYCWDKYCGISGIYEEDFDQDHSLEVCIILHGARGTGVNIERLIILEPDETGKTLTSYEFTSEALASHLKKCLEFSIDPQKKYLTINKDSQIYKQIDLLAYKDIIDDGPYIIDFANQINYEVNGTNINLTIEIGISPNKSNPVVYFQNDDGMITFDVSYDGYEFNLK